MLYQDAVSMQKKILITGANGFIGSFLVDEALERGYEVVAGVRATSSREFLTDPRVRVLPLAYTSPAELTQQLNEQSFHYVIHNAGTTGTKGTGDFMSANVDNTRNLVDALGASGRHPDRFLYISSLAVMGPGEPTTMTPLRVSDPERPITAYAQSKLAAERYLVSAARFPVVILRPTAVYGPRDRDFLALFKWIQRGFNPAVGTHRQRLSMIYVKDLASAAHDLLALPHPRPCYLASDLQAYDKEDLGEIISGLMGRRVTRLRMPLGILRPIIGLSDVAHRLFGRHPFLDREKLNEVSAANWLCDSGPLWEDLQKKPSYSLERGLRETLEWYEANGWLKGR